MTIRIENLVPNPLQEWDLSQSEVWQARQEFQQGEIIQVQAPSGKGKSTFMHILYGTRTDYEGALWIDDRMGKDMSDNQWADLRQTGMSIVFQDLRMFPDLTGWENIQLKLALTNYCKKDKVKEMATRLGVSKLLDKPAGTMSFGERQRMAIIRSLVQPFDFMLLDEPFSHLDRGNIAKASELIVEECRERNAGMLIAALNLDEFIPYTRKVRL